MQKCLLAIFIKYQGIYGVSRLLFNLNWRQELGYLRLTITFLQVVSLKK